jgi:hypothetical protein
LAKDSARAVVASAQAIAIKASNFTTSPFALIHLLDIRRLRKSHPVSFYWARRRNFDANQLWEVLIRSVTVPMSALVVSGHRSVSIGCPLCPEGGHSGA